jgi:sugar lactone lactonase YvrE
MRTIAGISFAGLLLLPCLCYGQEQARQEPYGGPLETVATLDGALPTGITVSNDGRIFVNYPQWGENPPFTVGELVDGKAAAYPDAEINRRDMKDQENHLISVQSVVVDPTGKRLWILDTGSVMFGEISYGGPKLIGVDLGTNKIFKKIVFPRDVASPTTYLNDVRFDLTRGKEGMAYITDSDAFGIIVVDLATGKSWRRLQEHASTHPDPSFVPVVEGRVTAQYIPGQKPQYLRVGSDGIAITGTPGGPDKWLYYCPLSGRHLFRVSVDALSDPSMSEADTEKTIEDLGEKGGAGDGMESDAEGRVYISDYEHNAIHRRNVDGSIDTLISDPRILWPDTLTLASNGYLYFTSNQLERQGPFQKDGKDRRQLPYAIFRIKIDGTRIAQNPPPNQ